MGARERTLLLDIVKHPFSVVTKRYRRLGWSTHTGTKVKRRLLEKGIVDEDRLRVPEGTVTLLNLTEAAKASLARESKSSRFRRRPASSTSTGEIGLLRTIGSAGTLWSGERR